MNTNKDFEIIGIKTDKVCYKCSMDSSSPWFLRGHGNNRGKAKVMGRSSQTPSRELSYQSSTNIPVIRLRGKSLINSRVSGGEPSSSPSIHLNDIPTDSPLYGQLQAYIAAQKKQSNTFASIASNDNLDDIKNYEKFIKRRLYSSWKMLKFNEKMNLGIYSRDI